MPWVERMTLGSIFSPCRIGLCSGRPVALAFPRSREHRRGVRSVVQRTPLGAQRCNLPARLARRLSRRRPDRTSIRPPNPATQTRRGSARQLDPRPGHRADRPGGGIAAGGRTRPGHRHRPPARVPVPSPTCSKPGRSGSLPCSSARPGIASTARFSPSPARSSRRAAARCSWAGWPRRPTLTPPPRREAASLRLTGLFSVLRFSDAIFLPRAAVAWSGRQPGRRASRPRTTPCSPRPRPISTSSSPAGCSPSSAKPRQRPRPGGDHRLLRTKRCGSGGRPPTDPHRAGPPARQHRGRGRPAGGGLGQAGPAPGARSQPGARPGRAGRDGLPAPPRRDARSTT